MSGPQPQARTDAARARLLEAAIQAFADRGFHGTTTRDIATAAGMSPAALYVHHRSKEELLHRISRTGHERTLALVRDALRSAPGPKAQLIALARAFAIHHARDHTVARIVNYEMEALTPQHRAEIRELRRQIEDEVRTLVERGVAAGAFRAPDPRMTAVALLSLGVDIARWFREDGTWSPEDVGDYYSELALRMVGVDPAVL